MCRNASNTVLAVISEMKVRLIWRAEKNELDPEKNILTVCLSHLRHPKKNKKKNFF